MKKLRYFSWMVGIIMALTLVGAKAWAEDATTGANESAVPEIYIKAVNPGYKNDDGVSNVGEMVEIAYRDFSKNHNKNPDDRFSLAGIYVRYKSASGREIKMVEFPDGSFITGESIILRLASSLGHELANLEYKTAQYFTSGIASSEGAVEIVRGDVVIDRACWGVAGCEKAFNSSQPTTLVRDEITGVFRHDAEYVPEYIPENYMVVGGGEVDDAGKGESDILSQCVGLEFSEILSYYAESQTEQFIELYNSGHEQILLTGCKLKYKNKTYPLEGIIKAEEYVVRYLTDFSITKNPTNMNLIEIVDANGAIVDAVEYPNGQRKGTTWAMLGFDAEGKEIWRTTYAVTPGEPNVYQEFRTCETGKVINETTGNCVKVTTVAEKVCAAGQYLNPLSGRCKKIEETTTSECLEGYERNPETGRCRKIKENSGANYALVTETYTEDNSFVAITAVLGVIGVGLIYIIYEFRHEIRKLFRRVLRRFRS